jgi:YbgC/YbaW family acyl-CoA thioester hydrolase
MSFKARIKVRFGDCDPAGLVYYPVIFHYCHVAMEEFFAERCGIGYHALLAEEGLGFPTVKVEAEFFAPLVYGDEAEIEVSVARLGRSSLTLEYNVRRVGSDHALCARSTQVHAAMSLTGRASVEIPAKHRAALAEDA